MSNDILVGVCGITGRSDSACARLGSNTGSSTTLMLLLCMMSCSMLKISSAREHLKAKIPKDSKQKALQTPAFTLTNENTTGGHKTLILAKTHLMITAHTNCGIYMILRQWSKYLLITIKVLTSQQAYLNNPFESIGFKVNSLKLMTIDSWVILTIPKRHHGSNDFKYNSLNGSYDLAKKNIIARIWCNTTCLHCLGFKKQMFFLILYINVAPFCPTFLSTQLIVL